MRAGRWELVRLLGQGGMGEVWLGRDPVAGDETAVKLLAPDALDAEHRLRFAREVEALVRLRHPHVVRWLEAGQEGRRPWVAMELCPGGTLAERVAKVGPLSPRAAVELARDLAGALAAAHAVGVLHRDLKPHNVMFDGDGQARLADFGLARLVELESLTETGAIMGSPGYLAPEQVKGEKEQLGPATDVWALGAVLYFLLVGEAPFHRSNVLASIQATLLDPAPAPSAKRPEVDARLDAIVLRCLAKSPAERWASAMALRSALVGWLSTPALLARAGTRWSYVGVVVATGALGAVIVAARRPVPSPAAVVDPAGPSTSPAASTSSDPIGWLLAEARVAWRAHAWDRAIACTDRLLKREAPVAVRIQARLLRSMLFAAGEQDELARLELGALQGTLEDRTREALVAEGLTALVQEVGDLHRARELFAQACELDPSDPDTALFHAKLLVYAEDLQGAEKELERTLALAPRFVEALWMRAVIRLRREGELAAMPAIEEVLRLAPHHAMALTARAKFRFDRDLAGALEDCERALALEPESAHALSLRAQVLQHLGDEERALGDLKAAAKLDPTSPRVLFNLGVHLREREALAEAMQTFDALLALPAESRGPEVSARAFYQRARIYQDLGQLQAARSDFEEALEHDPLSGGVAAQDRRILQDLDRAQERDPHCAEVLAIRSLVLLSRGDRAQAGADLDRAVDLEPGKAVIRELRAHLRAHSGDEAGARDDRAAAARLRTAKPD